MSTRNHHAGAGNAQARLGRRSKARALTGIGVSAVSLLTLPAIPALAGQSNHGEPIVIINPAGGVAENGTDGLRMVINADGEYGGAPVVGQDQLFYRNTVQYCCSAAAPMLNIGGTLFGESGPAYESNSWTSLEVVSTSDTASDPEAAVGNGGAVIRYTAVHNELTYVVERTVDYRYPNNYVTDSYDFVIPEGNTDVVKFYLGGDAAPGSSDSGTGVMLTSPVRTVYSVNPSSEIQLGYGEVPGDEPFDGALAIDFYAPYDDVAAGTDIGFGATASVHDAGIMIQWTLGSTPGNYDRSLRQYVGARGAALYASFADSEVVRGEGTDLVLEVLNTGTNEVTGAGFEVILPDGLAVGGDPTNSCGGTATITPGSVILSGGTIAGAENCTVTVPVITSIAGEYVLTAESVAAIDGIENAIGATVLTAVEPDGPVDPPVDPPAPVNGACPGGTGNVAMSDQIARVYGAVLGRQPDASGMLYWSQARAHGMTVDAMVRSFLASPERVLRMSETSNAAFVETLYQDVLGRSADAGGLAYWTQRLNAGLGREAVVLHFADSPENVARTESTSPLTDSQALACRLYQTILGREGESTGIDYWSGMLDRGVSPTAVATRMMALPESLPLAAMSDANFIDRLYQNALDRSADSAGMTFWSAQIATRGRAAVVVFLANEIETITT